MKQMMIVLSMALSTSIFAIEFITESQVGERLQAQKVIEVNKYSVQSLIQSGSRCATDFGSRAARAYVVKSGNQVALYLTPSGLAGLSLCKAL